MSQRRTQLCLHVLHLSYITYTLVSLRKISSLKNKSNAYKADIFPLFTFQSKSSHIAQKPSMFMKHHAWNLVKSCLALSSPTSLAYAGSISGNQNTCSNWAQEELSVRLQLELLKGSCFRHWEDSPGRRFSGTIQILLSLFWWCYPGSATLWFSIPCFMSSLGKVTAAACD